MQPCENQKHDWPELHSGSLPFVQPQLYLKNVVGLQRIAQTRRRIAQHCSAYGSIIPVSGCCPWLHGGSSLSIALRDGGMIIDA